MLQNGQAELTPARFNRNIKQKLSRDQLPPPFVLIIKIIPVIFFCKKLAGLLTFCEEKHAIQCNHQKERENKEKRKQRKKKTPDRKNKETKKKEKEKK